MINSEQRAILTWLLLTIVAVIFSAMFSVHEKDNIQVQAKSIPQATSSGRADNQTQFIKPVTNLSPIEQEIRNVFGKDADKATKVVMCESKEKSDAINDNTKWGGVGVDRGYWQINNIYHPNVSDACAKDIKCSTAYAYRMYMNDNKTFRRWSCGKFYNI